MRGAAATLHKANLVSIARFKRGDAAARGGPPNSGGTRGLRPEVPDDLVHEVSKENTEGPDSGACARPDTPDVRCERRVDYQGRGVAGSDSSAAVGTTDSGSGEAGAGNQGAVVEADAVGKQYRGQHVWARGCFCATVGAVDEATIKAYIENQRWDEDDESFKITAPTKP